MEDTSQPIEVNQSVCGDDSMISPSLEGESQTVGPTDENPKKNVYGKRERRKTSPVWNDFDIVEVGGVKKSQCKWCKKLFAISSSSSTSTLGRHLVACLKYVSANKKQKCIALDPEAMGDISMSNFTFKIERSRELAAHMILCHDYPFKIVEHEMFNKFCKSLNPLWKKVSRATIRKDCFTTYNIEKKKLKTLLGGVDKVNITTDMWTSAQRVSYMVVTCYFVDSDWFLQKRVLNFCNVPPPHSGVVIAEELRKCFGDWGIEDKVFTITVDNAKANDTAIRILKDDFELREVLPIGGRLFHVRCCAHITNLLVQAGLAEIGDIVDSVREGIKYIVASEGRLRKFSDIAKILQLPGKKLILDVPTRWNSTYMMLATAVQFKEVFPRYYQSDQAFQWLISPEEWEKVENVNQILSIFNDVTNIVSGSEYPTSNLFLPEVWRIKEVLLLKCRDNNEYIRAMVSKMSNKFEKYWGNCNLLMALAAVLDPRYKMKLIKFCFPLIYPEPEASMNIDNVYSVLHELYEVYVTSHNSSVMQLQQIAQENSRFTSGSTGVATVKAPIGRSRFLQHVRCNDVVRLAKTDLDVYLEEDVYICENDVNGEDIEAEFEALAWWKFNALKYRILSKMARDILAVPITTVASESSFSAGGRVIDPHRARLSTKTVEMILCGQDWVRALHGLRKNYEIDEDEAVSETFMHIFIMC
jgi:hypothetical protein